jgi:hypothetical protein
MLGLGQSGEVDTETTGTGGDPFGVNVTGTQDTAPLLSTASRANASVGQWIQANPLTALLGGVALLLLIGGRRR